jgi:hypothetical protein
MTPGALAAALIIRVLDGDQAGAEVLCSDASRQQLANVSIWMAQWVVRFGTALGDPGEFRDGLAAVLLAEAADG